jgi:hypothetical protein
MSNLAFQLDDASLRHVIDTVCRGNKYSKRRTDLEHAVIAHGALTLAELHAYRAWFASSRARGLLTERDYEMLKAWLTALVQRAVAPRASATQLHNRAVPMRPLRC